MNKRILTLDNLYEFFVGQNKQFNFSAKDAGMPIVVSVPGNFELDNNGMPGMLKAKLKVNHLDLNRNGSYVSKESAEKAMPTLKYRPVLAYIHQLDDGTYDFYAHNVEFKEDENGEEAIEYLEKQVGCFTADDPWLEYDEKMDKTYVMAYAVIPEEYTRAADIIRRKNGTKVSCELVINELAYNAKEKYLDLIDYYYGGTTLLGCDEDGNEIGEGMLGSRLDIADFCHEEPEFDYQDKLLETLEKLNNTLSNFSINKIDINEKGGDTMENFEENIVEVEETVADEPEVVVTEEEEPVVEETVEETSTPEDVEEEVVVVETNASKKKGCSINENGDMDLSFAISHEDIRYALYNLIGVYEEEDNDWYFISSVYDDHFIMENWNGNKFYMQDYEVDGDNVSLSGERQEMFKIMCTESEKIAIERMRENYNSLLQQYNELKAFKDTYDSEVVRAEKTVILESAEYAEIKEFDEFKALVADMDKYSADELKVKADLLFAAAMKKKFNFSAAEPKKNSVGVKLNGKPNKKKEAYGGLFAD